MHWAPLIPNYASDCFAKSLKLAHEWGGCAGRTRKKATRIDQQREEEKHQSEAEQPAAIRGEEEKKEEPG